MGYEEDIVGTIFPKNAVNRFWAGVDFCKGSDPATTCWEWRRGCRSGGYGLFYLGSQPWAAHRFSYTLFRGPIPPGIDCLHRCDNPRCLRPSHLFLGIDQDNASDMAKKGRAVAGRLKSGLPMGVRRLPGRLARPYNSRVRYRNKLIHLGSYATVEEAAQAVRDWRRATYGEGVVTRGE